MDIQKFVDIQMEKIRNHPIVEHEELISKMIDELCRLGYSTKDAQVYIAQNHINHMREFMEYLQTDDEMEDEEE